jgi:hypothetical protein
VESADTGQTVRFELSLNGITRALDQLREKQQNAASAGRCYIWRCRSLAQKSGILSASILAEIRPSTNACPAANPDDQATPAVALGPVEIRDSPHG